MAYQILSTDWVGELEDEWLPCLKYDADTLENALRQLCSMIKGDVRNNVSHPYRVVEVPDELSP